MPRYAIIFALLAICLTGCNTLRRITGAYEDVAAANADRAEARKNRLPEGVRRQNAEANGRVLADDVRAASKRLPSTLVGDSDNQVHGGDPIPPQ